MQPFIYLLNLFLSFSVYSQTPQQLPSVNPLAPQNQLNKNSIQEKLNDIKLGERDPFEPPKYIRDMELVKPEDIIDKQMEAIRRWPLAEYKLKGIIWDVKNPKAMILDKLNTLHLLKKNYRLGNREGLISEINESEIVVIQKGIPTVLQIEKATTPQASPTVIPFGSGSNSIPLPPGVQTVPLQQGIK